MSVEAITWALHQQMPAGRASAKHVLTIIANQANLDPQQARQLIAFPSIDYMVWATGQNRKTVIANMRLLQDWKLIEDTGRRVGRTRQIPIYRLNCGPDLFHEQSRKRNGSKTGTVPISEQSRILPETVPDLRERVPISGHGTVITKSKQSGGAGAREAALSAMSPFDRGVISPYLDTLPDGVDVQVFADFVKHRQVSRGPLSIAAWMQVKGELERLDADGVDLNDSLRETMLLGLAKPVDPRPRPQRGGAPPGKGRMSADFSTLTYVGTPDDDLPDFLRDTESAKSTEPA